MKTLSNRNEFSKKKVYVKPFLLLFIFVLFAFFGVFIFATSPTFTAIITTTNVTSNDTFVDLMTSVSGISGGLGSSNITGNWWINNVTPMLIINMPFDTNFTSLTNVTYDYSGLENNGTFYQNQTGSGNYYSSWINTSCQYGGCINFTGWTGLNTNITIPFTQSMNFTNRSFTIEIWVNPTKRANNKFSILHAGTINSRGFALELAGAGATDTTIGQVRFALKNSAGTTFVETLSNTGLSLNTWTLVTAIWDGRQGKIYLNGLLDNSSLLSTNDLFMDNSAWKLGSLNPPTNTRFFNGSLDNLRVWNTSLTDEQVYSNYKNDILNKSISVLLGSSLVSSSSYKATMYVANSVDIGIPINTSEVPISAPASNSLLLTVNFSNVTKTINFIYGTNEKDNWEYFSGSNATIVNNAQILNYHKSIHDTYIRVWVRYKITGEADETMPFFNNTQIFWYNYTMLVKAVNATLNANAIPYVTYDYAPYNMSNHSISKETYAPVNYTDFAIYVNNVTTYLGTQFDTTGWLFSFYNEADCDYPPPISDSDFGLYGGNGPYPYNNLYDEVYNLTKTNNPQIKMGGPEFCYLNVNNPTDATNRINKFLSNISQVKNASIDFISYHNYGNTDNVNGGSNNDPLWIMNNTKYGSYTVPNNIVVRKNLYYPTIPILKTENNIYASGTNPYLRSNFSRAWMASDLLWSVQSNLSGEVMFEGTSNSKSYGLGLWSALSSEGYQVAPSYYARKDFTTYNTNGSTIVYSGSPNNLIEILAVINNNHKYVTVINKYPQSINNVNISLQDISYGYINNLNLSTNYTIINKSVQFNMSGYEVAFFEVINKYRLNESNGTGQLEDNFGNLYATNVQVPIWFNSSSTNSIKYIASNLTETINATVIFNIDNCDISTINYKSNTSLYTKTYVSSEWSCNPSLNQVTLNVNGLEPAANSNKITITYLTSSEIPVCDVKESVLGGFEIFSVLMKLIALMIVFSPLLLLIIGAMKAEADGKSIDVKGFVIAVIGLFIIGIILAIAIITTLQFPPTNVCP